jgi:uncharacterized alpha-E superfamily protein
MLSRVAESMFWMSRYVERAENVARFIDVNCNLILDSTTRQDDQWSALVNTTGDHENFAKKYPISSKVNVIHFLTFDRTNFNSVYSCVRAARENARTVRDVISSDMWEQINTFYLMINEPSAEMKAIESPYEFFNQVKMASHLILGVADNTLSHGEGWNFCRLGRFIERCDKTSRILDVKYYMLQSPLSKTDAESQDDIQWGAVLKSASALEMYRKKHRRIAPSHVVEFLMLDPEFPRSILFCVRTAQKSLRAVSKDSRSPKAARAEELMAAICDELSISRVENILAFGLHEYLDKIQTRLNEVGDAVHEAFFGEKAGEADAPAMTQTQTPTQSQGQSTQTQSQK